jgi:acetyl-CoA C-acetyltransferase
MLKNMQGHDLGSIVVKENVKKSQLKPNDIDEVIMGQVLISASGQNPARQAAIQAGIPIEKTAYIVNQVCGSGLRAVAAGYQSIFSNDSKIVIAGGQESMSKAPIALKLHSEKFSKESISSFEEKDFVDTMIKDGLWDAFNGYHMGVTAENVAHKWGITRKEQDDFALLSQLKAEKAQNEKKFKDEIIPAIHNGKDKLKIDEHPRTGMTLEMLPKL